MSKKPVVCIPGNIIQYSDLPVHMVRESYVRAVSDVAGCVPLIIPAIGKDFNFSDIADKIDGILLTGSSSNVAPSCYGARQCFEDKYLDLARDATTLPLIRQAIEMDMPVMAICRGHQELNVATGGTLHQQIQELPGKLDHREPKDMSLKTAFETLAHKVSVQKGGILERIGLPPEFSVNSIHQQGVDKLGNGLFVEAVAPDGVIEAVSVANKNFILGVQWHPEGDVALNPISVRILEAFGAEVRKYASR